MKIRYLVLNINKSIFLIIDKNFMPLENSVIFRITKLINLNKSIINILIIIFNFFLTNNPIFINIIHKYFKLVKKI